MPDVNSIGLFFVIIIGIIFSLFSSVIFMAGLENYSNRNKKKLQRIAKRTAYQDANQITGSTFTIEEQIKRAIDRPVTAADLEYVNSLYLEFIKEEETLYKEKKLKMSEFYHSVEQYRNEKKKYLL